MTVLFFALLLMAILASGLTSLEVFAGVDPFPLYECIKPNVEFWTKVYGEYGSTQGILHDSRNLSIVYEVVELVDKQQRGAQGINRNRVRRAKKKYQHMLEKLGRGNAPSSPEEIRLAGLLGPAATPGDFRKAADNIRCQIGQMDRFREGIIRSGAFLDEIKEIFASHGLPADLAYLPHVESSFNHKAYSKFGAAGIWQFIRSTGKRFMEIGYIVDERRDPIRSSIAAAELLKEHYETLGDWPLAITAYNHGLAGILRAKQSKGSYPAIFEGYESRLFKFASRNFYAEFLAALHVAKNYQQYFRELILDKPLERHEIVLAGHVAVKDLVRHFGVDVADIRSLNPSLREPVFRGQKFIPKGYTLRLPADAGGITKSSLVALNQVLYRPEQKRSPFYRVQEGDTASAIAQSHGVSLSEFLSANDLDPGATIYAGQFLRLPFREAKPVRVAMSTAEARTEPEQAPDKAFPRAEEDPKARSLKETVRESSHAMPGEKAGTKTLPADSAVIKRGLRVEGMDVLEGRNIGIIRVEAEETLGHYAEWLDVAAQKIRALNGFKYRRGLRLHESLKIPLEKVSKEAFQEKRLEYHKEIEEDFFGSYRVEAVETYRIKRGDNIWTLCAEVFELPLWVLIKYNPSIDFNNLKPSQELIVPVVEATGENGASPLDDPLPGSTS